MTLAIPQAELGDFARLKEECRTEIRRRLAVIGRLLSRPSRGIQAAIAHEASLIGCSPGNLRKHYDLFRKTNDWRVLVDRRRFPEVEGDSGVPAPVVELWKTLCERNQRKCKPAYRELMRLYHRRQPEGLQWPELDPATGKPRGCTYRNLLRYRPDDFSITAMRDGLGVALGAYGPKVLTTRVGLWVGSHFVIDDVKRDLELLLLGHGGQIVCPQELGVLDLYSGDRFAVHRRPLYLRADGKKDSVKEREMRFLIASTFRNIGYSSRGTEIVAELGTATVRELLARWLHEHSGGKITVRLSGIVGREQALAGYWGRGGGNPRHKAALESHHNLIHNEAANLPAPTGHDRRPPEWLHGLQAMTEQVLDWMRTMPPEEAAKLQTPHLEYWQGLRLLAEIDQRIAFRTDHELEGWVESGHTTVEYRADILRDDWLTPLDFAALPEGDRQTLTRAATACPAFRRSRKLAPREVFSRGAEALQKLSDHEIALLFCDRDLGDDLRLSRPKRLTADGCFELQDGTAHPEPMFFRREVRTPEGGTRWLAERTDHTVAFNPFDAEALWVYDTAGAYLGTAPRIHRASPLHVEQIHEQLGRRSHEKAALLAPLAQRHAESAALIRTMQEENAAVVADAKAGRERETLGSHARAAQAKPARAPIAAADLAEIASPLPVADEAAPEPGRRSSSPISLAELQEL